MKKIIICLTLCLIVVFVISAFCAGPVVDFDGAGNEITEITPRVNEIKPDISAPAAVPPEKVFPAGELEHTISARLPSGEWEIVKPAQIEDGKSLYYFLPTQEVRATWKCASTASDNWAGTVRFAYYPQSVFSTGHAGSHSDYPFLFSDGSGVHPPDPFPIPPTPKNESFTLSFNAPVFAVKFSATVTPINCGEGLIRDELIIRVPNLKTMPQGGPPPDKRGYELVTLDPTHHPSPHNVAFQAGGTSLMKDALSKAARVWQLACGPFTLLQFERMSLPLGGVIDKYYNWGGPYFGHIWGEAADIGKQNIHPADRRTLINILCRNLDVWSETDLKGDSEPPWYHAARPNLPAYMSTAPNPNSVYCCTEADAPDACIDLGKGFAESPFLTPSCPANLDRQAIERLFNKIDGSLQ